MQKPTTYALALLLALTLASGAAHAQTTNPAGSTTTVSSGTYSNPMLYGNAYDNSGTLTVTGGTFENSQSGLQNETGATVTVSGGTFTGNNNGGLTNDGTAIISGGTFENQDAGVDNEGGTVTVSGGTFSGNNFGVFNVDSGTVNNLDFGTVNITGGTFTNNYIDISAGGGTVNVYGTSFTDIMGTTFTSGFGTIVPGINGSFTWTASDGTTPTATSPAARSTSSIRLPRRRSRRHGWPSAWARSAWAR
jgi:hypothetical protein